MKLNVGETEACRWLSTHCERNWEKSEIHAPAVFDRYLSIDLY